MWYILTDGKGCPALSWGGLICPGEERLQPMVETLRAGIKKRAKLITLFQRAICEAFMKRFRYL